MILTITMNPSVDILYSLDKLVINDVNRVSNTRKTAGGKGLNVTRGINFSNIPVLATGIIGGTTGKFIQEQLDEDNIDVEQFLQHYKKLLNQVKIITISGSLPLGFPVNFYVNLIELASEYQIPVLLDSSGQMLLTTLKSQYKPYLIKPNQEELKQIIQMDIDVNDSHSLIKALKHDSLDDIPLIVISLGKNGAFARCFNHYYQVSIPKINVVNPVGSGDITLAGLAVSLHENESIEVMLKRAMTMGMLNAMEAQTGFVNMNNYHEYYQQVEIKEII